MLQHLQDISTRLLLQAKPDRLAALRQELTSLNHTLPSEVCLPLWCECGPDASTTSAIARAELNASAAIAAAAGDAIIAPVHAEELSSSLSAAGASSAPGFLSEPVAKPPIRHHRIVRIDPTEAVVLNSADRAPYLLHVEVLRNDLDFDPDRRGNRELCERLVRGEQEGRARRERRRETSGGADPSSWRGAASASTSVVNSPHLGLASPELGFASAGKTPKSRHPSSFASSNDSQESSRWARNSSSASQGSVAGSSTDKALPHVPGMLVASATASAVPEEDNTPVAGTGTNPASGINPMSEVGPGPSSGLADPDGPLETMFADLAMGDVGARGNEEALAAAAASLASSSGEAPNTSAAGDDADGASAKKTLGSEDIAAVIRAVNKDDPSAAIFRESWSSKKARIRASSPYGHLPEWDVFSMIVKTGADLRQEQLAVQLIHEFGRIWAMTGSRCWTRYFRILVTGEESGLMETITDSVSVHSIKKEAYSRRLVAEQNTTAGAAGGAGSAAGAQGSVSGAVQPAQGRMQTYSLCEHFQETFGDTHSPGFKEAQTNFIESLAGYSIISYILQIKDRHNGNILIDHQGHIIHIDFGFMLGISPGGVGFEAAPFKFPQEYIDILGGMGSEAYERFKALMRSGFRDVRKHAERIIMIVELMLKDSKLPCFALNENCAVQLRDRFQLGLSQTQCDEFVDRLVLTSAGSVYTRLYDRYQSFTQGIL